MPTYPMICPNCEATYELVEQMDALHVHKCACGAQMMRNWQESSFNTNADSYSRDIHSDALAISPSQVEEHRQHFPDVQLDNECRPVFTNYKQHQAYLDKTGFRKKRQRIRRRGPAKQRPA